METTEYETPKEFRARMHERRIKEAKKESAKRKEIQNVQLVK